MVPDPSSSSIRISNSRFHEKININDNDPDVEEGESSTELKLATLISLLPHLDQGTLLDLLISADGSVEKVIDTVFSGYTEDVGRDRKRPSAGRGSGVGVGYQSSLSAFRKFGNLEEVADDEGEPGLKRRRGIKGEPLTRKGQTLHLYSAEDIARHTPCSIIHNFLPSQEADDLLKELLEEASTFERQTFKVFDNVVQSPHSACFYVDSLEERQRQKTEYLYNGSYLEVSLSSLRLK